MDCMLSTRRAACQTDVLQLLRQLLEKWRAEDVNNKGKLLCSVVSLSR